LYATPSALLNIKTGPYNNTLRLLHFLRALWPDIITTLLSLAFESSQGSRLGSKHSVNVPYQASILCPYLSIPVVQLANPPSRPTNIHVGLQTHSLADQTPLQYLNTPDPAYSLEQKVLFERHREPEHSVSYIIASLLPTQYLRRNAF
jgi:hypothetical protein